jgi:hypothetical protein
MAENTVAIDHEQENDSVRTVSFTGELARREVQRIREKEEERARDRRQGRIEGKISHSLKEKLTACNILQLQDVKRRCNKLIKRQKAPPTEWECTPKYVVRVLVSVAIRNKRFQLELRRNSARAKRLYVNGPYICAYWRDGKHVRPKNYSKEKRRQLPRKVWREMKSYFGNLEVEELRKKLGDELSRRLSE